MRLVITLATVLAAGGVLAGCGGGNDGESGAAFTGVPVALQDPGAIHIHGLGFDATANVLYLATHTGLFELLPGSSKAVRIGESRQDTMGFSAVRSNLWLGSGHPDGRSDEPPHLGLISSSDQGRTWRRVSLSGKADFHVLRARGKQIYGYDVRAELLLVSSDEGKSWTTRPVPEPLLDLAIDPKRPSHLVASGSAVLYESKDAGRTWHATAGGITGQLAWPATGSLYVVDPAGAVLTARSAGGNWRAAGDVGGQAAALLAVDARLLFVALHDGTVKRSGDGGAHWTTQATP